MSQGVVRRGGRQRRLRRGFAARRRGCAWISSTQRKTWRARGASSVRSCRSVRPACPKRRPAGSFFALLRSDGAEYLPQLAVVSAHAGPLRVAAGSAVSRLPARYADRQPRKPASPPPRSVRSRPSWRRSPGSIDEPRGCRITFFELPAEAGDFGGEGWVGFCEGREIAESVPTPG